MLIEPELEMGLLQHAIAIATVAHGEQTRRGDLELYINHPLRVARMVRDAGYDEITQAIAVLHDVVEDTKYDLDTLRNLFMGHDCVDVLMHGIWLLTKTPGMTREEYKQRLFGSKDPDNRRAVVVKMYDAIDNGMWHIGMVKWRGELWERDRLYYRELALMCSQHLHLMTLEDEEMIAKRLRKAWATWNWLDNISLTHINPDCKSIPVPTPEAILKYYLQTSGENSWTESPWTRDEMDMYYRQLDTGGFHVRS